MGKASLLILSLPELIRTPSSFFCFPSGFSRGSFLGGGRSIQLSYSDVWSSMILVRQKPNCNPIFNYSELKVVTFPFTRKFIPAIFNKSYFNTFLYSSASIFSTFRKIFRKIHVSLKPDRAFESPAHLRFSNQILFIDTNVKIHVITCHIHLKDFFLCII